MVLGSRSYVPWQVLVARAQAVSLHQPQQRLHGSCAVTSSGIVRMSASLDSGGHKGKDHVRPFIVRLWARLTIGLNRVVDRPRPGGLPMCAACNGQTCEH